MPKSYAGVEDLLCDEAFLSWYFKTDRRAMRQWERWIADNPGSRSRIQQAVEFIQSLHVQEEEMAAGRITRNERMLLEKIRAFSFSAPVNTFTAPVSNFKPPAFKMKWWMAAAAVLVLATGIYGVQYWLLHQSELNTAYGEIKDNKLPDGTEVMVNADSRVRYSSGWKDGKDREVWLTGEAYFHVRKTPLKSRFIVHAGQFDIIVTGTRFNVVNRQGKANVMLQEGSVILHTPGGKEFKMTPGDFVEYNNDQLAKRSVKSDSVIAWKDHRLSFNNTSLREVAAIIKEQYGVTVRLTDETMESKTITGIMSNDNLDVLLQSLALSLDVKVTRQSDEVIIQ